MILPDHKVDNLSSLLLKNDKNISDFPLFFKKIILKIQLP